MRRLIAAIVLTLLAGGLQAQTWPLRPITLLVPFRPGVATSDEGGIPGLYASGWFGLFAPREQQTPEGLAAFNKAEIEKWWPIVKAAGIRAE